MSSVLKRLDELKNMIQRLSNQPQGSGSNVDDATIKAIHDRLNQMQNEINLLRNEFSKYMKELQDALNGKADLS